MWPDERFWDSPDYDEAMKGQTVTTELPSYNLFHVTPKFLDGGRMRALRSLAVDQSDLGLFVRELIKATGRPGFDLHIVLARESPAELPLWGEQMPAEEAFGPGATS